MVEITRSVEVAVPASVAYEHWTRFADYPRFLRFVDSVEVTGEDATRWTVSLAGRRHSFDARIVERSPGSRLAWEATDARGQSGAVDITPLGVDRCRVAVTITWTPSGFAEKAAHAAGLDARMVADGVAGYRDWAETG